MKPPTHVSFATSNQSRTLPDGLVQLKVDDIIGGERKVVKCVFKDTVQTKDVEVFLRIYGDVNLGGSLNVEGEEINIYVKEERRVRVSVKA